MTPTPDDLRTLIVRYGLAAMIAEEDADLGYASADAWKAQEADNRSLVAEHNILVEENRVLGKRLEAAEKRAAVVERRLVYVDFDGDWDELEGYVQVALNNAALAGEKP